MKINANNYSPTILTLFLLLHSTQLSAEYRVPSNEPLTCHLLTFAQHKSLNLDNIYHRQLTNGLKVYVLENHELPIFSLRVIYNVGAADEKVGESGYAHLFEHMMFKGSKNVPDGGHFAAIRQVGGHVNATTDYDKTAYWSEAPINFLERVLWLEAERMQNLMINEANLENQRQAVLEEKLLRIDNVPYFKVASEFMVSAWQGTDYDHLVIGTEEEIKNATLQQVQAFFNHYYQPENAILILVGDVNTHRVIKNIESTFNFKNNKIDDNVNFLHKVEVPAIGQAEPSVNTDIISGKSERRFDPLAPFPLYALGWHTPGKQNLDFYAVELLADILLKHDASRLNYLLKEEQGLVFETIGFPLTFEQRGITAMGMVPHSYANFSQIQSVVKKEIEQIRINGVSDEELCSAKKHRQLMLIEKMSTNRQMTELIGDGVLFFNNPSQAVIDLNNYQNVDNAQIKAAAQQYFNDDWLALEIVPGPGIRFIKWVMEILPHSLSQSIEQQFL